MRIHKFAIIGISLLCLTGVANAWWWQWYAEFDPIRDATGTSFQIGIKTSVEDTAFGWYYANTHGWADNCQGEAGRVASGGSYYTLSQNRLQDSFTSVSNGSAAGTSVSAYVAVTYEDGIQPRQTVWGGGTLTCSTSGYVYAATY